jgi:hypothetical protein
MLDFNHPLQGSARAPIRPLEPTLADVLAAIEHDVSMPESTRNGLCCSIRRLAKFLGRDPAQLPARFGALRYGIARLHHAQLGISRKTLQNHVANLKAAVRRFTGVKRLSGRGILLTLPWKILYDQLTVPRLRLGLSSFLRYCSACGVDPSSVSDATVEAFIRYAGEVQFTVKPRDLHKQVARCWNRAKDRIPDWPPIILTIPDFRPKLESLPWGVFLPSLVQDVEGYLARLAGQSLLDEDAPDRPCKPSTIENRRTCLRLAATAAVMKGMAIEELRSLADLVSPQVVRLILEHYIAKKDGEIVSFTIDLAERLLSIARLYVKASPVHIQALEPAAPLPQ